MTTASENVQDNHLALCKLHALELFLKFDVAHHFIVTFPFNWVIIDQTLLCRNCLNQTSICVTKLLINLSPFVNVVSQSPTAVNNCVIMKF